MYQLRERVVDYVELIDLSAQLLLYSAQSVAAGQLPRSLDRVFQLLPQAVVVLLQTTIFRLRPLHSRHHYSRSVYVNYT